MTDRIRVLGDPKSKNTFVQMVDDHDLEYMDKLMAELEQQAGSDWCLVTVKVKSWNQDLMPWEASPVFGNEGFGDGASGTLQFLLEEVIPEFEKENPAEDRRYYIAGYSLAGLFALWAGYSCDAFTGVVAASPSVWYPGWNDFAKSREFRVGRAYLSLGDKESRTRNQVMAKVGENIERQQRVLWIHGGGYVLGMKEMVYMSRAEDLVKKFGAVVISPGYRLAFQKPYPAAINDCYGEVQREV